jgi:competence protein ComEC
LKVLALLVYFILAYATYYRSQKYGANPYLWLATGILLPYLGCLMAFLYFRKKEITNPKPSKMPLGFRSRKPWKIIIASLVYGLFIIFTCALALTAPENITIPESSGIGGIENNAAMPGDAITDGNQDKAQETELSEPEETTEPGDTSTVATEPAETEKETAPAQQAGKPKGELKVHFIDVGQADCILVQAPEKTMLIDAGNNADSSLILSYLKGLKISRIDVLVGTHPHEDHIGSLDSVIDSFDIGVVYMPKISTNTKTFEDVLLSIKNKGLKVMTAKAGVILDLGEGVKAEMVAPNSDRYEDINDYSAVIKLTYGETSFLFTGDAEAVSEKEMVAKGYNLKADVLKVGHHGSTSSTSPVFLKAVSPKYAIISVGKDNQYGHPDSIILNRLKTFGVQVYRTDESGTIIAATDGKNITFDKKASPKKPQEQPAEPGKQAANGQTKEQREEEKKDITVYITKSGTKYHSGGCRYLSKSQKPISLSDAKNGGYTPCSRCNPPR